MVAVTGCRCGVQVNSKRTQFYHIEMPETIDKIQVMDETRSEQVVQQIGSIASSYSAIGATTVSASAAITKAVENHNKTEDSKVFAQLHMTTAYLPDELTVRVRATWPCAMCHASVLTLHCSEKDGMFRPPLCLRVCIYVSGRDCLPCQTCGIVHAVGPCSI